MTEPGFFFIPLHILLIGVLLSIEIVRGQVGVAYSPFVRDADHPNSAAYTRNDVIVMLKLVLEQRYSMIGTYGVGAPAEKYTPNHTWKRCSSVVHSALAAAEINQENRAHVISVYQGMALDATSALDPNNTEIEVGFEVANIANNIYAKTVTGLISPPSASVDVIFDPNIFNAMKRISARAHKHGLEFGARFFDCIKFAQFENNENVKTLLGMVDFVICLAMPRSGDFSNGPQKFAEHGLKIVISVADSFARIRPTSQIKIMLETGWPGGDNLGSPNTDVSDMIKFWNLTATNRGQFQVFMHEAFDNPWKIMLPVEHAPLASHMGRLKHKQIKNDNSKNAYELKVPTQKMGKEKGGLSKELIVGLVFGLVLFIVLVIIIIVVYRRVSNKIGRGKLTEEEIRQFMHGIVFNEVVDDSNDEEKWKRMPYNSDFELEKGSFSIDKNSLLGSGQFGSVYKGKMNGMVSDVAFKMTRPDCPLSALRGLLSEIKILAYLGKHENLVSLCGAYTAELTEGNVFLAIELCPNGSLEKFLRSSKSNYVNVTNDLSQVRYVPSPHGKPVEITDLKLLQWSLDIASAMEFISSKNVIHADLATRNVLLTSNLTAKVTDFGLSRRLYEYTEYVKKQQEPLPWRWMAIESLKQLQFSSQSDVWSYGVTIWEIYSFGDVPYPGLTWNIEFVSQLENGLRMQKPSRASAFLYDMMIKCWHLDPQSRPTFKMIKETLQSIQNISIKQ